MNWSCNMPDIWLVKHEVFYSPFDLRLHLAQEKDEEIVTVVQPDLEIICDRSKLDNRGCKGAPDLIIEIISPATAKKECPISNFDEEEPALGI